MENKKKKAKKVLMTGVTGFIGSHLALKLANDGYEVYGVAKPSVSRNTTDLHKFLKDITVRTCDITDYHSLSNLFKTVDMDIVVHLAALSPVKDSFEKPFSYLQTNMIGTANIVHSLLSLPNFKEKKLVYASTAEVYGMQEVNPTKEDTPFNPSSPYAVAKAATDMYIKMANQVYGLNSTIMRCTNTYGRKINTALFTEYVITTMLKGGKVYIGAPDSIRDYMYIDDHVDAYVKAIENFGIKGEAFNFGIGLGKTNKEVAFMVADILGYDKGNIVIGRYPPDYPSRPPESDQPFIVLDSTKAHHMLGWKPQVSLEEGLKRSIAYWKNKV